MEYIAVTVARTMHTFVVSMSCNNFDVVGVNQYGQSISVRPVRFAWAVGPVFVSDTATYGLRSGAVTVGLSSRLGHIALST